MAVVVPPKNSIRAFKTEASFETWLKANHSKEQELYLRIYKKGSGMETVTYAQALDVALCWGWIDGLKKSYDELSFLQRFTPRKAKSQWSQINREHVARLIAARRMTPAGQKHIDAAKADGRWEAAYASPSNLTIPDDLLSAIEAEPKAKKTYQTLSRQNLFALVYRLQSLKTEAARTRRIEAFVSMLSRGETLHPSASSPDAQTKKSLTKTRTEVKKTAKKVAKKR